VVILWVKVTTQCLVFSV